MPVERRIASAASARLAGARRRGLFVTGGVRAERRDARRDRSRSVRLDAAPGPARGPPRVGQPARGDQLLRADLRRERAATGAASTPARGRASARRTRSRSPSPTIPALKPERSRSVDGGLRAGAGRRARGRRRDGVLQPLRRPHRRRRAARCRTTAATAPTTSRTRRARGVETSARAPHAARPRGARRPTRSSTPPCSRSIARQASRRRRSSVGDPLVRRPRHQVHGDRPGLDRHARRRSPRRAGGRSSVLDVEPNWGASGGLFHAPGFAVADAGRCDPRRPAGRRARHASTTCSTGLRDRPRLSRAAPIVHRRSAPCCGPIASPTCTAGAAQPAPGVSGSRSPRCPGVQDVSRLGRARAASSAFSARTARARRRCSGCWPACCSPASGTVTLDGTPVATLDARRTRPAHRGGAAGDAPRLRLHRARNRADGALPAPRHRSSSKARATCASPARRWRPPAPRRSSAGVRHALRRREAARRDRQRARAAGRHPAARRADGVAGPRLPVRDRRPARAGSTRIAASRSSSRRTTSTSPPGSASRSCCSRKAASSPPGRPTTRSPAVNIQALYGVVADVYPHHAAGHLTVVPLRKVHRD